MELLCDIASPSRIKYLSRSEYPMLTEKYRPKSLKEFAGNGTAAAEILAWVKNWKNEPKKILLIHGKPGTGKTTLTELIAKELNYHLVATNASDMRSAKALHEGFGHSLEQQSLFFRGKLVVFDEVDGLSAGDRGGAGEILKIAKNSKFPIILLANDIYVKKLDPLKKASKIVAFHSIYAASIEKRLKEICEKEGVSCDEKALKAISTTCGGDLKAAINDLETILTGKKEVTYESSKILSPRDSEMSIQDSLRVVFKTLSAANASEAMRDSDKPVDELIQWIRENIPLEYERPDDVARAYVALSRANIFMGRIVRQQYWDYMGYASQIAGAGVALAKTEKYSKFVLYKFPTRIAMMGRSRIERAIRDKFAAKLAEHLHCGRRAAREYLPLLSAIEEARPEEYEQFLTEIGAGEADDDEGEEAE